MTEQIIIEMIQDDLKDAIPMSRCWCPVANAIRRVLKPLDIFGVVVSTEECTVMDKEYLIDDDTQAWIRNFDDGGIVTFLQTIRLKPLD